MILGDGGSAADGPIGPMLWDNPAAEVMRHAGAGYEEAIPCAREHRLNLFMVPGSRVP